MMSTNGDMRNAYLERWARYIMQAANQGALTGKPCPITKYQRVCGPRAAAIHLDAGLYAGKLKRALGRDDCAILRQFVPWQFEGNPQIFMSGRWLRIEAGWPDGLAQRMIHLDDVGINSRPDLSNQWVAGIDEWGGTVIPGLWDHSPHFLFAGTTGAGKSVALQSAVLQLCKHPENRFILCDGKSGKKLRLLERLPGVLGPCAMGGPDIRNALGWAAAEMYKRAQADYDGGERITVVFDEFQALAQDRVIMDLMRKLTSEGRERQIHFLAATQHPTVDAFKYKSTRRNLDGKVALRVGDADASRVAVGGPNPRADYLQGSGDAYVISAEGCHRTQLIYVGKEDIEAQCDGTTWRFTRWPDYEPLDIGQDLPEIVGWSYRGDEVAVSIVAAAHEEGRPAMIKRLQKAELGRPGAERAIRLLELGRDAYGWLRRNDYAVCKTSEAEERKPVIVVPDVW